MIYLDNAATSHPKPRHTRTHLLAFIDKVGGNPGRSGHTASVEAARIIFDAREKLAALVNVPDSERIVFTHNGTDSLNLVIMGLLRQGDHVITSSMEHNSVMRPLTHLQQTRGVEVSFVPCTPEGQMDAGKIRGLLRTNTRAVIVNHGSNVTGTVQDLVRIRQYAEDAILIVDACQTIGSVPLDVRAVGIDALCFSCHKSLYGLQGVGAAYLREGIEPEPLRYGGTGSRSESVEQPSFLPDKYESGTPNTPGIAALTGGLTFIEETGLTRIIKKEESLVRALLKGLSGVDGVTVYGNHGRGPTVPVVSFNMRDKLPSEVGYQLNRRGIYTRVGLQCSPAAHTTIGTFPHGTVRVSPGYFTTRAHITTFIEAVREIAQS